MLSKEVKENKVSTTFPIQQKMYEIDRIIFLDKDRSCKRAILYMRVECKWWESKRTENMLPRKRERARVLLKKKKETERNKIT